MNVRDELLGVADLLERLEPLEDAADRNDKRITAILEHLKLLDAALVESKAALCQAEIERNLAVKALEWALPVIDEMEERLGPHQPPDFRLLDSYIEGKAEARAILSSLP